MAMLVRSGIADGRKDGLQRLCGGCSLRLEGRDTTPCLGLFAFRGWSQQERPMFQVTERAATALQEVLAINNAPPKQGVRLVPTDEGRLGMTIDRPREGDQVVQRDDTPVLIADRQVAAALTGVVLDLQPAETEAEGPPRFTLRRQH